MVFLQPDYPFNSQRKQTFDYAGADLGGGCRGCAPPQDDLRFSNTTGILQKKKKLGGLLVLK